MHILVSAIIELVILIFRRLIAISFSLGVRSEEDQQDYSLKGTIKFHVRGNDSFHVTPELKKKALDDLRVYLSGNGLHFTTLAKKDASFTLYPIQHFIAILKAGYNFKNILQFFLVDSAYPNQFSIAIL